MSSQPNKNHELETIVLRVDGAQLPPQLEQLVGSRSPAGGGSGGGFELSPRGLLTPLFRHKLIMLACALVAVVAAVGYVKGQPNLYASEARVMIRGDRTGVTIDPAARGTSLLQPTRAGAILRREIGLLTSDELARRVVERKGAEWILTQGRPEAFAAAAAAPEEPAMHREWVRLTREWLNLEPARGDAATFARQAVLGGLSVRETMEGSTILSLNYLSTDASFSREVLAALVDEYLKLHIEINSLRLSPAFLKAQAEEKLAELESHQARLSKMLQELNIVSLPTDREWAGQRIHELEASLSSLQGEWETSRAQAGVLERFSQSGRPNDYRALAQAAAAEDPTQIRLRERLAQMQVDEARMLVDLSDDHPRLVLLREEIKATRRLLAENQPDSPEVVVPLDRVLQWESEKARLESLAARRAALQAELDQARKQLSSLVQNEQRIQAMQRNVAILEQDYAQLISSQQVAQIAMTLDQDQVVNVSLIQPPTLASESSKNMRKMLALLAFIPLLGLGLGMGVAFGLDVTNTRLRTAGDITSHLGLPVLVSLPHNHPQLPILKEASND